MPPEEPKNTEEEIANLGRIFMTNLKRVFIVFSVILLVAFLLWMYAAPKRCYCAGQRIDCAELELMREALRVNGLSQRGLRNCY